MKTYIHYCDSLLREYMDIHARFVCSHSISPEDKSRMEKIETELRMKPEQVVAAGETLLDRRKDMSQEMPGKWIACSFTEHETAA